MDAASWPPAGVRLVAQARAPGSIVLAPIAEHRVVVHLSEATASTCRTTGYRCVRQTGDVDLTPSGEEGGYDADTASSALEVRLATGFVARVADELHLAPRRASLAPRHLVADAPTRHLAWAFIAEHQAGGANGRLYLDSLGVALAVRLLSHASAAEQPVAGLSPRRLQHVLDYIEANLATSLDLVQLAAVARASSAHLRRWFPVHMGESVHRYIVRRRVERARELLILRALPASEVAAAVGFAHQSHMARWMRRLLGATPRELSRQPSPMDADE
jgi:AraC family transcriptional regulator